jgi:Cys-tRNA(Pro)/Cys-tRNA(Cys) deacylase
VRTALEVHQELLAADVRHEIVHLRSRVGSADDLPRVLDLSDGCAAVRCFVPGSGVPPLVAVLVRAGTAPDPRAVLRALRGPAGAGTGGLRPATACEVNTGTDFAAGLVCPVGLPADVPLLVDEALAARQVLYTAAGEGAVALGIRTADLLRVTGAVVAALAAPPAVVRLDEPAPGPVAAAVPRPADRRDPPLPG